MEKLDLSKAYKAYYSASTKPQLVEFDHISYVSLKGKGDPNGSTFAQSTEALYTVAYGVKGHYKKEEKDFTVAKLEGQWWVEGDPRKALEVPKAEWLWKILIRMPESLAKIELFLEENHLSIAGLHHEIYLSDPRKVAPEKLKTILRYPVRRGEVVKG